MIRVVFDANVFVAGLPATSGALVTLIKAWRAGAFQVVVSEHIMEKTRGAWTKPYWCRRFSPEQVDRAMRLIQRKTELTPITVQIVGVATHAEDDVVLATAVSGRVDYLVTSDHGLRGVDDYQGIVLLSPREFLDLLKSEGAGR